MNCHPRSGRVLNLDKLFVIHLVWFCESCRELPVKCKPQAVFRTFFENLIDQFFLLFCISIQFCIIFQECQVTDPVYLLLSPATLFQALENIWICFFFAQKISVCPERNVCQDHRFFSLLCHILFQHRSSLPQIDTSEHGE